MNYCRFILPLFLLTTAISAHTPQDPKTPDAERLTAILFYCIAEGNLRTAKGALEHGADPNRRYGNKGDTPLIYAIRALADLNNKFTKKIFVDMATFRTAYYNRMAMIRLLLFHPDIRVNAKNNNDQTAFKLATAADLDEVASLIIFKMQASGLDMGKSHDYYLQKLAALDVPEKTRAKINEEVDKLATQMHPTEAGKQEEYLRFIFSLPWNKTTADLDDINRVGEALDADHYGLTKVKDKILEYLAVKKISDDPKIPILCFVGPPGTGKTSIAKSIARGLGKNFERVALGGAHEERAIRGSSKTYIAAEPGDILKALKRADTNNPVILLDEIDKMATNNTWHGNPAAALLEVLDPEQNDKFVDHFADVPFDLSTVMFITTANSWQEIDSILLDRMEIVEFDGYTNEEKINIATQFVIPKVLTETGMAHKGLTLSSEVVQEIIHRYALEAGVRKLEQKIRTLCSKAALYLEKHEELPQFTTENLVKFLGAGYDIDTEKMFLQTQQVGVVNGLYVMRSLGEGGMGTYEARYAPGKGELKITGNMVGTSLDAAKVAYHYIRTHEAELGIDPEFLKKNDLYIHAPTANQKDGNSAGITKATAFLSAITRRAVDRTFAMTGEVTLSGRVFPIGGVKKKILGAKRMGITKIIIPEANRPDFEECKDELGDDIEIFFVRDVKEVFDLVLLPAEVI